ncbi:molybdenum cofactor cytidylyltransferase [Chloroflexota bacterium]
MTPFVSAIVLAAGSSRRLGKPKQLLPIGDTTILERTLDNVLDSRVNEVVLVLGYQAEKIAGVIAGRAVKVAVNLDYKKGMSAAIKLGLSLIDENTHGIMLVLADQPFVDGKTINRLLESFSVSDKDIIAPTYHGQMGHPVVFSAGYRQELLALEGDVGGREIMARHPGKVREVPVDCEGVVLDIDTPDAYHIACQKLRGEGDN